MPKSYKIVVFVVVSSLVVLMSCACGNSNAQGTRAVAFFSHLSKAATLDLFSVVDVTGTGSKI